VQVEGEHPVGTAGALEDRRMPQHAPRVVRGRLTEINIAAPVSPFNAIK
jgi:hypothetical protein